MSLGSEARRGASDSNADERERKRRVDRGRGSARAIVRRDRCKAGRR